MPMIPPGQANHTRVYIFLVRFRSDCGRLHPTDLARKTAEPQCAMTNSSRNISHQKDLASQGEDPIFVAVQAGYSETIQQALSAVCRRKALTGLCPGV